MNWGGENPSYQEGGDQQLGARGQSPGAVPPSSPVEQLRATGSGQANDVLDIGQAGRECAESRLVKESASHGDEANHEKPAADLEAPIRDIAMRNPITRQVQRDAKKRCRRPRPHTIAHRRAGSGVQRDDHTCVIANRGLADAPPVAHVEPRTACLYPRSPDRRCRRGTDSRLTKRSEVRPQRGAPPTSLSDP